MSRPSSSSFAAYSSLSRSSSSSISNTGNHHPNVMMQRVMVYGKSSSNINNNNNNINNNDNDIVIPSVPVALQHKVIPTRIKKGHVLVKVVCAGLNPVDAKHVIGDKLPHSWTTFHQLYRDTILAGNIIGFDFAGIVVQGCHNPSADKINKHKNEGGGAGGGAGVSSLFQPGDHVFGTMPPFHGTLAEYIMAPLDQIYYKPKQHSFAQAAALPLVGLTALQALSPHLSKYTNKDGDDDDSSVSASNHASVLIIGGSGGTGHVACQVARNLGAKHVTTICSRRNAKFCQEQLQQQQQQKPQQHGGLDDDGGSDGGGGATRFHVVDYQTSHAELVHALQNAPGCPFHVVLDCVTSSDPRDAMDHHYPSLLQHAPYGLLARSTTTTTTTSLHHHQHPYIYLRLGGSVWDWFRAGLRRVTYGICDLFRGTPEQLFWVRFPNSADELRQLVHWADDGLLTPHVQHNHRRRHRQQHHPHQHNKRASSSSSPGAEEVEKEKEETKQHFDDDDDSKNNNDNKNIHEASVDGDDDDDDGDDDATHAFTPQAVEQALHAILSRRVKGKLVVRVSDLEGDNSDKSKTN